MRMRRTKKGQGRERYVHVHAHLHVHVHIHVLDTGVSCVIQCMYMYRVGMSHSTVHVTLIPRTFHLTWCVWD